jgi:hypothetical protein
VPGDGSGGNSSGGSAGDGEEEYAGEGSGNDMALRRALMLRWGAAGGEGELERAFTELSTVVKSVSSCVLRGRYVLFQGVSSLVGTVHQGTVQEQFEPLAYL